MSTDSSSIVQRLLGPRGPEISCDECFEQLDRYVEVQRDGGGAEAAVPGLSAHLEGCLACREDYESLRALTASDDAPPAAPAA